MSDLGGAHAALSEAGLLPRELPSNFTFDKVREILAALDTRGGEELRGATEAAKRLGVRGPLASALFVKHHAGGAHEVEVDRVEASEEGGSVYAVLVYPEGELPLSVGQLPAGVGAGTRLRYEPEESRYVLA
ncbi:MAG TPA: hypothetical protein VEQ42_07145 [Pyrinomonadaceae bacterium]|nr:hypothetical protein [Pyrinomonadaceae bacterium]